MKISGGNFKGKIRDERIEGEINGEIGTTSGRTIIGTIEKGVIIKRDTDNTAEIEGIIKGVIKTPKQTIERLIKGKVDGINGEEIEGNINATIKENSHYNAFKICKKYIEDASESEYQLWPVIDDPNVP